MLLLLATLWLWDAPTCGETPVAYRVESVWLHQIASIPGMDDDGNMISMPIYSAWLPVPIQESAETQAWVPCQPAAGEVCVAIVTSIDEAGNVDSGEDCP